MSRFRRRASRALRAANAVADQRGLDPYDLENVVMRLAKGWICQPRSGVGSSGDGGDGDRGSDRVDDVFIGGRVGGARHGESVFVADSREVRLCPGLRGMGGAAPACVELRYIALLCRRIGRAYVAILGCRRKSVDKTMEMGDIVVSVICGRLQKEE